MTDASGLPLRVPFFELIGLEVLHYGHGTAECATDVGPWLSGTAELGIHAAAVALADCVLSHAVTSVTPTEYVPATLRMSLDFLREPPPVGARLVGDARVDATVAGVVCVRGSLSCDRETVANATVKSVLVPVGQRGGNGGGPRSTAPVELPPLAPEPWTDPVGDPAAVLALPAAVANDLRLLRAGNGVVEVRAEPGAELARTWRMLHGGAVPILGQLAIAAALATAFPKVRAPRRLSVDADYLRPTPAGEPVTVRARVVHRSSRVAITDAEILNADGKPTARVHETSLLDVA
ncbi:MAG: PaaI family thioesterase [Acidimicrobiia bacterium]